MTGDPTVGLDARIGVRIGDLDVAVDLAAGAGEVVALLGPNGAGKTTVVRALAGLLALADGRIALDGQVLDDPAAGVFVPPEARAVGVVFQDHLLFPRMSVRDNVAFGPRATGMDRRRADGVAEDWLERLDLAGLGDARPGTLSGGQAQRVALARALATQPRLLLLDEPLAALDATTRLHVRAELRRHLAEVDGVRVLVTHDPIDALVLADRLVIVEAGVVTQLGRPADVAARPGSRYVADLVGINLLHGRLDGTTVQLADGGSLVVAPPAEVAGAAVAVAIRPQAVALHRDEPAGSPRNAWQAVVADLEADRDRVRVRLAGPAPLTAEITAEAALGLGVRPGEELWASVKAVDIAVYEA